MMPGENAPPIHPHCRCSISAYEDTEEYEVWLDFLDKGGTTADWNKFGKAAWKENGRTFNLVQGKTVAKVRIPLANIGESSKFNIEKHIDKKIINTDNQSVREWYYSNVHDIPNKIDKAKPFEEQVKQAFELRNKYKHEARVAMSDIETAKRLEELRPAPTFEELLIDKMNRKNLSKEEALKDILETASKTNANVDKEFGLGGDNNV